MSDVNEATTVPSAGDQHHTLRESVVKDALEKLDWQLLRQHLDEAGLNGVGLEFILGHLLRARSLIMPYPNAKREALRAALLESLGQYVVAALGPEAETSVSRELALLDGIERGYRGMLEILDQCEISKRPPEVRVASYISRAVVQYDLLIKQVDEIVRARKELSFPQGPLLVTEENAQISPDTVIDALVETLTMTLEMEARRNGWLDGDGNVVLPALPVVGDDERSKAGATELLAMSWRRWRRTEERRRFLGGAFEEHEMQTSPAGVPSETQRLTVYRLRPEEIFDYIANERLRDQLGQMFVEMLMETNIQAEATGIAKDAPLLPGAFISAAEVHAAVSLSETLSYDIAHDEERPGGLRLVEWLRGYAVLQELAQQRSKEGHDPTRLAFAIPRGELLALLGQCGLKDGSASHFVDAATLKLASRDMFDCPLIRMVDGSLMVFVPALLTANLTAVVLSAVSALRAQLPRKGKAFEEDILSFFRKQELRAESFRVSREGEEYEYDVVVVWGDYVFLFECKNHGLSNRHPERVYYFQLQVRTDSRQVKRLAAALTRYPDILREALDINPVGKRIVPCVLNALPYSLLVEVDGVYFTDASSLKRFFHERYFHIKTLYPIDENLQVLHRTAMHSLWAGDKPTPEDLIRHLEEPFQLNLMLAHTDIGARPFPIADGHFVAAEEFFRTEMTIESFAELVGVSAKAVRKERTEVARQLDRLKARLKKTEKGTGNVFKISPMDV